MSQHLRRQTQPLQSTSAAAYADLCSLLFSAWAQTVRTRPAYARCARSLLSNTHQLWADQQACPTEYADSVRSVLVRLQGTKHRQPQGATAPY